MMVVPQTSAFRSSRAHLDRAHLDRAHSNLGEASGRGEASDVETNSSRRTVASSFLSLAARLGFLFLGLLFLGGCPTGAGTDAGPTGEFGPRECMSSSECPDQFVCAGGSCVVGECLESLEGLCDQAGGPPEEVAPYCCQIWENCQFDFTCGPDPDSPIGLQCQVSEDCPDPGQFCSGGSCFDSAGRTPCTATFQCSAGERCDRTVFSCVPDIGGCELCEQGFPELCCEDSELCDAETGFCLSIDGAECTVATEASDCLPGRQCDMFGRCVQCITDDDCGPGTSCNEGTGSCFSDVFNCMSDDDCDPPRLCATLTDECVNPQCVGDAQCAAMDPRLRCDTLSYTCFLPSAECNETDEPNNSQADASPASVETTTAGTLCRGDLDYLAFAVTGDKRYRVTVATPDFNAGGIEVALVRDVGGVIDSDTFSTFDNDVTLSGITDVGEVGTFYVRVNGSGTNADLWNYTVSIEESNAPLLIDCADEMTSGIEPNDDFAMAYEITPGAYTFARCDDDDLDYYRIDVPAQSGLEVTIEFDNDSGDLALKLYEAAMSSAEIDSSDGASSDIERVEAPEGVTRFWIRAALWSTFASGTDGQAYTLTATAVSRPAPCDQDPGEPANDDAATAPVLALNTTVPQLHCVPIDVDNHRIEVPANFGGTLDLTFNHNQGDLRLDLYDENQVLLNSSNSSAGADAFETLELPFSGQDEVYIARVRLHAGSSTIGQDYALRATTYDATTCVASEPLSNGSPLEGRCVGTFTSPFPCVGSRLPGSIDGPALNTCNVTPGIAGCGTLCGSGDEDWYRIGPLNNGQLLFAQVEYDTGPDGGPSPGRIGLALARANPQFSGATYVRYDPNPNAVGVVTLQLNAPSVPEAFAREYMVIVTPEGNDGFAALPYTLDIVVGAPCFDDAQEPNANPSQSSALRVSGTPGVAFEEEVAATLCSFDTDVYELFAFASETVTATLLGGAGMQVAIGTRPADITDDAVTVATSSVVAGPCPIGSGLDGGTSGQSCVQASFANDQVRQIYLTVFREAQTAESIGDYTLRLNVD